MKVICVGLGKTGTTSLAKALRILGYTVYDTRDHLQIHTEEWLDLYRWGKLPDFASMYQDIDAVTAIPPAFWYEEILQVFPDSKVILTVRDSEEECAQSWARQTEIGENQGVLIHFALRSCSAKMQKHYNCVDAMCAAAYGSLCSKSVVLFKKKYREHNERVRAVISKEKLLVYNVKQGWKPLCEFLGCDVPEQAFPRENVACSVTRNVISNQLQELRIKILLGVAGLVGLFSFLYFICL